MSSQVSENVPKKGMGNSLKSGLLKNLPKEEDGTLKKTLESLNLQSIESQMDQQQQQSAKDFITEYQHLFVLNLNELGKTSLVQHDIKLDDMTPFKE